MPMDISNLGTFDNAQLSLSKGQAYNYVAGYLAAQGTDFEDEEAVNDALSLYFKGASLVKEELLEAFEVEADDEEAAA